MVVAMERQQTLPLHDRIEQASAGAFVPHPQSVSAPVDKNAQPAKRTSLLRRLSGPNASDRTGSKRDGRRETSKKSRQYWKRLPAPILELVLLQLKNIHVDRESSSCTTCYMRDLSSMQRTCKAWFSDTQRTLYTHIDLVGQEDPALLRRWRLSRAARLVRLRSTLRSRPLLAALVKTINVPDLHIPLYLSNDNPNPAYDAYLCTLASVVMACPNLEAFSGFTPFYNHTFDRLTHALSTRTKLRQHVWVIAENDEIRERSLKQLPPGLLDENQYFQFKLYHQHWKQLETLMLCSPGGLGVIEYRLFKYVLRSLPSLKNLCVSSFDADDFNDKTLRHVPGVTNLRLEECLGVTEAGLTRWAARPKAVPVKCLSLIHQNVTSLLTISKILASLDRLRKFTIVQTDIVPTLPFYSGAVVFQPVLASKCLKFLHWDVFCNDQDALKGITDSAAACPQMDNTRTRDDVSLTANEHLAQSILHNGFPALTRLRAPRDTSPDGLLQSVCQPLYEEGFTLPKDDALLPRSKDGPHSNSLRAANLRALKIVQEKRKKGKSRAAGPFELSAEHDRMGTHPTDSEASVSTLNTLQSYLTHSSTNTTATNQSNIQSPVSPIDAEQQWMYRIPDFSGKETPKGRLQDIRVPSSASKRDSICNCEFDADSICACDAQHNPLNRPPTPPKSPLRHSFRLSQSAPFPGDHIPPSDMYQNQRRTLDQVQVSSSSATSLPTQRQRQLRPIFYLKPDVPYHDANGGIVGWAELLRIKEKARMAGGGAGHEHEEDDFEDETMCTGSWNSRYVGERNWNELDLVKELSNSNSSSYTMASADSESEPKWKSRLKSGSNTNLNSLSLPLRAKVPLYAHEKSLDRRRHVARPRGERGGSICVNDFF
ncbi:hypothetical protein EDD37DRAFT_618261 [Exophiala viscosa]|uniref:uncharacterized protein n=1 Tax=Exophiala viscosa TaxID=2486360 RepID=UPI00219B918D|nr:hypothetical protein EDD37DRAFT_618261 [Exophiala viscosa]